jgi:rubrerythrin
MDLNHYDIDNLLLTAIKSEVESKELYLKLAKKTQNGLLQDKLRFLADEEEKHRIFIEEIYKNHFPKTEIKMPDKSVVPLPEIIFDDDTVLSKILNQAMKAEQAASDFYKSLAQRFEKESKIHNTLMYFADMEIGHLKILENEKFSMERFEEDDVYWPMTHVGP